MPGCKCAAFVFEHLGKTIGLWTRSVCGTYEVQKEIDKLTKQPRSLPRLFKFSLAELSSRRGSIFFGWRFHLTAKPPRGHRVGPDEQLVDQDRATHTHQKP